MFGNPCANVFPKQANINKNGVTNKLKPPRYRKKSSIGYASISLVSAAIIKNINVKAIQINKKKLIHLLNCGSAPPSPRLLL